MSFMSFCLKRKNMFFMSFCLKKKNMSFMSFCLKRKICLSVTLSFSSVLLS